MHTPCVNIPHLKMYETDAKMSDGLIMPEIDMAVNQPAEGLQPSCNNESDIRDSNNLETCINQQGVCNTPLRSNNLQKQNSDTSLRSPSNTIGAIIRGYKSAVTKQINMLGLGNYKQSSTIWQRSFHEHIIRDEQSYQTIRNYIINNPSKWDTDKYR